MLGTERKLSDETFSPPPGTLLFLEGCFACAAVLPQASARSIVTDFTDCNWLRVNDAGARPVHGGLGTAAAKSGLEQKPGDSTISTLFYSKWETSMSSYSFKFNPKEEDYCKRDRRF